MQATSDSPTAELVRQLTAAPAAAAARLENFWVLALCAAIGLLIVARHGKP